MASSTYGQRAIVALRIIVSAFTIWILFRLFPPEQVFRLLKSIGPTLLFFAILTYWVALWIATLKWRLLLPAKPRLLFRATLAGCFYSILPSGVVGGELSKVLIVRSAAHSTESALASVMLDKLTGVIALLAVCSVALAFSGGAGRAIQLYATIFMMSACGVLIFTAPHLAKLLGTIRFDHAKARRLVQLARETLDSVVRYQRNRRLLALCFVLGVLNQLVLAAVYLILAPGLGIHLETTDLVAAVSVASLATLLPISAGGFGVREAGLTALLTVGYGIPGEQGLALALAALGVSLTAAIAGGGLELRAIMLQVRP